MTNENNNGKPVTYVTTYRGVRNHKPGLYVGKNRDVLITGGEFNSMEKYRSIPKDVAESAFQGADHSIRDILPRIDEMVVYLGKNGTGPGFNYIKESMDKKGIENIKIVACDCGKNEKINFSKKHSLPITWSECGGMDTLESIVHNLLR